MKKNKTHYAEHLEKVLKNNGIDVGINTKRELQEGYHKLQDLIIDSFYGSDELDQFEKVEEEQTIILTNYLNEGNSTFVSGRNEVLVTPSAKEQGSYQITYFDKKGAVSDSQKKTIEDTVSYIKKNGILPITKNQAEYLTKEGVQSMTQPTEMQQRRQQLLLRQTSIEH